MTCVRNFLRVRDFPGPTCMISNGGLRSIQVKLNLSTRLVDNFPLFTCLLLRMSAVRYKEGSIRHPFIVSYRPFFCCFMVLLFSSPYQRLVCTNYSLHRVELHLHGEWHPGILYQHTQTLRNSLGMYEQHDEEPSFS